MLMLASLLSLLAFAAPDYVAERDPLDPVAHRQYRLILRTTGRACDTWHKVELDLPKEDLLVSSTKKEEGDKGCRFLWVISPAQTPGPVSFLLDPIRGPKETSALPAPANYVPPKPADNSNSPFMHVPGVADEDGTGPALQAPAGKVSLPSVNLGTGK